LLKGLKYVTAGMNPNGTLKEVFDKAVRALLFEKLKSSAKKVKAS